MIRNAFDNLGTESALRRIANLLTFARDSSDRIRTIVDSGTLTVYARASSSDLTNNNTGVPFSSVSWNAMDARETQRVAMRANADAVRRSRWTY